MPSNENSTSHFRCGGVLRIGGSSYPEKFSIIAFAAVLVRAVVTQQVWLTIHGCVSQYCQHPGDIFYDRQGVQRRTFTNTFQGYSRDGKEFY